ncbi:MAG: hypothetical protein ACREX8_03465, partial [Gammaproteobacteria bacterium]
MTKRARFLAAAVAASSLLVAVPGAQAEVRVGKNYRLNSDSNAFRGKDAPALGVNPSNPNHVVQVANEYLGPICEGTASFDGGATWSTADPLPVPPAGGGQPFLPACSTVGDHAGESMFQTVGFGSGQDVYVAYASRRQAGTSFEQQSIIVAKSTDGGRDWTTATLAIPGGPGGPAGPANPYYLLPSIAVQRGAGTGGADRV